MELKRYELEDITRCGEAWREMNENTDGDYVLYEDIVTEIDRLNALKSALIELVDIFIKRNKKHSFLLKQLSPK